MSEDSLWTEDLKRRTGLLRESLECHRIDGLLLTSEANVRYLTGFSGSESAVFFSARRTVLVTDFRYVEEARETCPLAEVVRHSRGLMDALAREARRSRAKRLGFDPAQFTVIQARALRKALRGASLVARPGLVEELRGVKSAREVAAIEEALRVAERAYVMLWRRLRPGMTEMDVASELDYIMRRRLGAQGSAFETIVAFDDHASQPHAKPGSRRIRNDGVILIDWGARKGGYNCDLTRTSSLGTMPKKALKARELVIEAQRRAIAAIRPGAALRDVDGVARRFLVSRGYGRAFGHGLGHGVGLEIHELPTLGRRWKGTLRSGMVVTVEPGVYLPGEFGVRIEDMVLVTGAGARVLSSQSIE